MGPLPGDEVSFGPLRLSVQRRVLSGPEGDIPISGRAFDLLLLLIQRRGTLVSKAELMDCAWPRSTVDESNLHVQMAAIRRVLTQHQLTVLTVPGRGYRLVGDLVAEAGLPLEAGTAEGVARPSRERWNNLPPEAPALIGRDDELRMIREVFDQARLVSLVGPGGVGKTQLARAAARSLLKNFLEGCWLVDLESVADPALVANVIAGSLRVEEIGGRQIIDSLIVAVRQHPMLLVLDGCEHVAAAVGELASRLLGNCPELRMLCTSQVPLGIAWEHVRRIAPFAVPETSQVPTAAAALDCHAVRLFAERVAASERRFILTDGIVASVLEICRSLDGIPLAIELAAARVPLLGLEPVRARIANRLDLLGGDSGVPVDRHRTLRAAIGWSYGLLTAVESRVLRRLSVFAGGFTLAAAQEVVAGDGLAEWDIVGAVSNLVRRSLLTAGPDLMMPRHRMLEAMRDFCLETWATAEERGGVARRHADYFWGIAERAVGGHGPAGADMAWEASGDAVWMDALMTEIDNLRAALAWSLDHDPALGARLAAAMARFWFEAGFLSEGRDWLIRALAVAPADLEAATLLRLNRGLADLSMGGKAALPAAIAAVALAAGSGDRAQEGVCLRMLSAALYRRGRYEEAEQAALRALELLRVTGRARTLAKCYGDLCILRSAAGDLAGARNYNAEASMRLDALGDVRGAAICLQYTAELEFMAGNVTDALDAAQRSITKFRTLTTRYHLGIGLSNLAAYRLANSDPRGAHAAAREAMMIAHELEDEFGVVIAMEHIALALALSGAAEAAAKLHGYAEDAHERLGLGRQETEKSTHSQLHAALGAALAPDRLAWLVGQGRLLTPAAALALADANGLEQDEITLIQ